MFSTVWKVDGLGVVWFGTLLWMLGRCAMYLDDVFFCQLRECLLEWNRPGFFVALVGFFLCPQPVWMEGSPGVVCTSGVVCRDEGHLSALCRLVSLLHVDRGGVLQALCRHAGFESNPALQRHGPTKIPATLFRGFESDLTGRGKVRKKPCKHFWRV